jgi:hypothetical protein
MRKGDDPAGVLTYEQVVELFHAVGALPQTERLVLGPCADEILRAAGFVTEPEPVPRKESFDDWLKRTADLLEDCQRRKQ